MKLTHEQMLKLGDKMTELLEGAGYFLIVCDQSTEEPENIEAQMVSNLHKSSTLAILEAAIDAAGKNMK